MNDVQILAKCLNRLQLRYNFQGDWGQTEAITLQSLTPVTVSFNVLIPFWQLHAAIVSYAKTQPILYVIANNLRDMFKNKLNEKRSNSMYHRDG